MAITDYLIEVSDAWLNDFGIRVATPREAARRGSHVVLEHPLAWQLTQALLATAVVSDYRDPNRLRLGPAPAYTRFEDVYIAMSRLRDILATDAHRSFAPARSRVT